MKLSKIYSNKHKIFEPINFNEGLNVILAEVRDPANKNKDTHNLGKTTLSRLIDFCLLKGKENEFFLFKSHQVFNDFVFFVEVKIVTGYLTIRRSVEHASKIAIKKHEVSRQDYSNLTDSGWDHCDLPFEKAKDLLDALLDLRAISPFSFRTALGYSLRIQKDYQDVFQLDKFRGKHSTWKPYLAKILGFDASLTERNYALELDVEEKQREEGSLRAELVGLPINSDKIAGMLLLKEQDVSSFEDDISNYNFHVSDSEINQDLVDNIEKKIASLNERRYHLAFAQKRIEESLQERIIFSTESVKKIFDEANLYFEGQIKKSFDDLITFNKTITEEREGYLKVELKEISEEIVSIGTDLAALNDKRAAALSVLKDKQTFSKYRKLSSRLVEVKADVETLKRQKEATQKVQALHKKISALKADREQLKDEIQEDVESQNDKYKNIRLYFSEVVKQTIDRNAVISTKVNENGNLEFFAEILNEKGRETNEDLGHTYRKLLCIAFDMAIARAYSQEHFIHFMYHDGILEALDDRKKENLIVTMRDYSKYGIQQIITSIDADLPLQSSGERFKFKDEEVVKVMHDEGDEGRLFKMPIW